MGPRELTSYEQWQLEKYGNYLPEGDVPDEELEDSAFEELDRLADFQNELAED